MSKVKAFLTVLFSAIGVFAAREFYKPRNIRDLLKGRGVKLASDKRAGDSMFFENQKELEEMNIGNSDELGGGCNGRFKQNNLNDENELSVTKKYCSDNPTTIMARIIREGEDEKVIKEGDSEAFAINYQLSEDRKEVLELIGYPIKNTSFPKPLEVSKVLSEGCEKQKRIRVVNADEKGKIAGFKTRCYNRGVKTVSELLVKQGKTLLSDSEKYKARYENGKFQYVKQLMNEIKDSLQKDESKRKKFVDLMRTKARNIEEVVEVSDVDGIVAKYGGMVYKEGCEENLLSPLLKDEMYPHTYKKVSFRCTEEGAN